MKLINKIEHYVDLVLLSGLILSLVYQVINRFIVKVPDTLAYPWMIASCILMFVGLFKTGIRLGGMLKK